MDQAWDRAHGPRPSTASVQVQELSWQGLHNPCPQSKDPGSHPGSHSKQLVEEYLSPARLVSAGGWEARAAGPAWGDVLGPASSLPSVPSPPSLAWLTDALSPHCVPPTCSTFQGQP